MKPRFCTDLKFTVYLMVGFYCGKKKTQKTSLWDKIRGMFFSEIALLVTESFHLLMFGQKIFVCLEKALNIKV